jgi:hypothetical protein|tara:strand:+ start:462 stop:737 length:276 start_codon:yes stop_codon:yes gene_type:complete
MSQYRVTLRGMLPIEVEVIVEANTIADAEVNAMYPYDCWLGNQRVWAVDSYTGSATNEMDMNPSDLFDLDLKLQLTKTKVSKILKADEVEV